MSADEQTIHPTATAMPAKIEGSGRYLVLVTAFLGWFFAGVLMSITSQSMRAASIDLLDRVGTIDRQQFDTLNKLAKDGSASSSPLTEAQRQQLTAWRTTTQSWFAYYTCAFLFGAATGGFVFGRVGDRWGRSKAMAASILCYSAFSGAAYLSQTPVQLLVLWYLACLGVGGMWPNGVALVSEIWSSMSRPMVSGIIGTSANIGIFLFASLCAVDEYKITPSNWRWVMIVGAAPVFLGLLVLFAVPESPHWLASRATRTGDRAAPLPASNVFSAEYLRITVLGIVLATVPIVGGWGSANWMVPWAGEVGEAADPPQPLLQAHVGQARALTGIVGSLVGGWVASLAGRRSTYFLTSLAALLAAQYTFWFMIPTDQYFLAGVAGLGFFSGLYFGWMPLCLPELFPTRVRSTGAGVSFNFGRVATAVTVFATGALMQYFDGDYARIGRITSLIFAIGMCVIWLVPDTSRRRLED